MRDHQGERRQQKHDRNQGVGNRSGDRIPQGAKRHPASRDIAHRIAPQERRRRLEDAVPQRRFDPGRDAPFQPQQRRPLQDVQRRAEQGDRHQGGDGRVKQSMVVFRDDPFGDQSDQYRGEEQGESAQESGHDETRQIAGNPRSRQPPQLREPGGSARQRRVEHERVRIEGRRARCRHAPAAYAGRIKLAIAAEEARQQGDRLSAVRPETEQRTTVANPPSVFDTQTNPPAANAGSVERIAEIERFAWLRQPVGGTERQPLVPPDHAQRGKQLGPGTGPGALVEHIEQIVCRSIGVGATVNGLFSLQVGGVDQR